MRHQSTTKLGVLCILSLLFTSAVLCQGKTFKLGIEFQGYPTGLIPGVRGDLFISDFSKVAVRAGYNIVRHGDAGEHDDERGSGPGFSIGYDVLPFSTHRWTFGIRSDIWFNTIDWKDEINGVPMAYVTGTTNVTVLQPTVQAGYRMPIGERIEIMPTLSFGYEINVHIVGSAVGHGPIGLGGVVINYEL